VDLPREYDVNATLNVYNLSLFNTNESFREKKGDMIKTTPEDPLQVLIGSIIRLREKKLKYAFNEIIQSIWSKMNFKEAISSISDD
jgi:hypothetical protein